MRVQDRVRQYSFVRKFGRKSRLSLKVILDLDKYLSPILSAEGIYKIEHLARALAEADPPSFSLRRGSQFCDTFGGQNWYRTRLIDTNQIYEKHLVQSMVFFISKYF